MHDIVKSVIAMYRAIFFIDMVYGNIGAEVRIINNSLAYEVCCLLNKNPLLLSQKGTFIKTIILFLLLSVVYGTGFADNGNLNLAWVGHFVLDFL